MVNFVYHFEIVVDDPAGEFDVQPNELSNRDHHVLTDVIKFGVAQYLIENGLARCDETNRDTIINSYASLVQSLQANVCALKFIEKVDDKFKVELLFTDHYDDLGNYLK